MDRREREKIDRIFPEENDNQIYFRDHKTHHELDDLDALDDEFDHRYRHRDDHYYRRYKPIREKYYPRKQYHDEIDHEFEKEY